MTTVSRETHERLERFADLLVQWNAKINLVSPRDIAQLWPRHIEDSLQLAELIPEGATITDLGSGGGFPGIILAIATGNPVTLIESDQRKCAFLREAGRICEAKVTVIAKRIEAASPLRPTSSRPGRWPPQQAPGLGTAIAERRRVLPVSERSEGTG